MHTKIVYTGILFKKGRVGLYCQKYQRIPAHTQPGMCIPRIPTQPYTGIVDRFIVARFIQVMMVGGQKANIMHTKIVYTGIPYK